MTDHIQFSLEKQALVLLDQRILPNREEYFTCSTTEDVIYALQTMVVRGAPAIGVTAAYGCWLALRQAMAQAGPGWRVRLDELLRNLENARPTAVNLRWAVELMRAEAKAAGDIGADALSERWLAKAKAVHAEDIEINKAMGRFGAEAIEDGDTVMTHCNAGALATAGYGTALGVIRAAVEQGKRIKVIANETRPFLQGARLTAYELARDGIDVTVACDNAVGHLMKKGMVQKVVVGADRIAANGDAANKIGTYTVALAAKAHGVPFYVAAPASTFDLRITSGEEIPIENRTPREVTHIGEHQITPEGVPVLNYAFDVTPAELIAGIATERGLLRAPYVRAIKEKIGSA
ncbi:S-methyl-5-thioribose-1-phosphate isomerase [Desulfolutivibrio sulfoxidireducens]|uniref:S-methyl-5-thioribose-1-phosphate isomerase n=1 Tax=Desulfolutivibrio sulfoxidireducens TaxID=2773299 RepID=UPI00159D1BC4|nr:S-methyl-5-thioribose-1-phosphate isomerase [Desulfolutivibrio sulfoxidireducens]QLA17011.1 S-methyl-5-thioribose-1-phosphate isomerase [Desulfolutivibrio sulfoxidireducens]